MLSARETVDRAVINICVPINVMQVRAFCVLVRVNAALLPLESGVSICYKS